MSGNERIPLAEAERLAEELVEMLRPASERIEIAGSIRRRKADVGDIELVAVPRTRPVRDMFGRAGAMVADELGELLDRLLAEGRVQMRPPKRWGTRFKAMIYRGVPVDLFSVLQPAQWGVVFCIRTGPAEFSRRFVTHRRRGGMLPEWLVVREGALWQRMPDRLLKLVEAPEEGDVFRLLGIEYVPPEARR
jgi:DNA polymerase/3'-5' exonuclease PolX